MKIRSGFVSNSSSSSFVCQVCNEDVSGMNMELEEAEMFECVNHHIVCDKHILDENIIDKLDLHNDEDGDSVRYNTPIKYCPLCQFKDIMDVDIAVYLRCKYNNTRKQVLEEISNKYKTYIDFKKAVKNYENT